MKIDIGGFALCYFYLSNVVLCNESQQSHNTLKTISQKTKSIMTSPRSACTGRTGKINIYFQEFYCNTTDHCFYRICVVAMHTVNFLEITLVLQLTRNDVKIGPC